MSSEEGNGSGNNLRSATPESLCAICLEEITNRCHSDNCRHAFCFECLKRWSAVSTSCPLCKKIFTTLYHSFTENSHESHVTPPVFSTVLSRNGHLTFETIDVNRFRMSLFLENMRSSRLLMRNWYLMNYNGNMTVMDHFREGYAGLPFRRRVYINNLWAQPLPNENGLLINCDITYFRDNPEQIVGLYGFVYREVDVIREILRAFYRNETYNFVDSNNAVTNIILHLLTNYAIRTLPMTNVLMPYLGPFTMHFCHEFYNFASCPYNLDSYDRNVRYFSNSGQQVSDRHGINMEDILPALQGPSSVRVSIPAPLNHRLIPLNSNNNAIFENRSQGVINISSDSDVEMVNMPSRPSSRTSLSSSTSSTETTSDLFSQDQPSTSSGIQNSVNEPYLRYNLRTKKIYTSNGSPVLNTGNNQTMQTLRGVNKRVRKTKQNQRKRKVTNSGPNNRSQSSSEDTDSS